MARVLFYQTHKVSYLAFILFLSMLYVLMGLPFFDVFHTSVITIRFSHFPLLIDFLLILLFFPILVRFVQLSFLLFPKIFLLCCLPSYSYSFYVLSPPKSCSLSSSCYFLSFFLAFCLSLFLQDPPPPPFRKWKKKEKPQQRITVRAIQEDLDKVIKCLRVACKIQLRHVQGRFSWQQWARNGEIIAKS